MTQVKQLKLRLYVEGIEIPVVSAKFTGGVNMPSQAAMQIIPTDDVHALLPRTMVDLAWHDDDSHETGDQAWKVVWSGEFLGYRFVKSMAGQRSVIMLCADFSNYWDVAKLFYLNAESMSSSKAKDAAFLGATVSKYGGVASDRPASAASAIYRIISGAPVSIPGLRGLLGGLVHMLERIGGITKGKKKFRGLNDFFSAAELRLKLAQMIGASPHDTTSIAMFKTREFRKWIKRTIGKKNAIVSFRQVLEMMLKRVFHQYSSHPCAFYRPETDVWVDKYKRVGKSSLPPDLKADAEAQLAKLKATYANIQSGKTATGETRNDDAIRAAASTEFENAFCDHEYLDKQAAEMDDATYDAKDQKAVEKFRQAEIAHREWVVGAEEALGTGATEGEVAWFAHGPTSKLLGKAIDKYEDSLTGRGIYKKSRTKVRVFDRYLQAVLSPDLWFAAPPRPNIIFPDEYEMFNFQREFMAEATRLQMTSKKEYVSPGERMTGDGGGKKKYWAPLIDDVYGKLAKVSARKGAKFVMAHEIYTGLIARFEFMPNIAGFKKTDRKDRKEKSPIPYLQRIANFLFFKYRYGPRTGSLRMPFTPRLIPGHPCLIIDRFVSDGVREELGIEPVQYLGVIQRVDHVISQTGGYTTVVLTHLRTHQEQADFLGAGNVTVVKRVGSKNKNHTFKAKIDIDPVTGKPLGNPKIIELRETSQFEDVETPRGSYTEMETTYDVAPEYSDDPEKAKHEISEVGPLKEKLFKEQAAVVGAKGPSGGEIVDIQVDIPTGVDGLAVPPPTEYMTEYEDLSTEQKIALLDQDDPPFEGVRSVIADVTAVEKIGVYRKHKIQVPLEEAVRPPWVAAIYDNTNIGPMYYMDMFGCQSLVDPLTVGQPETRPGGSEPGQGAGQRPNIPSPGIGPLTGKAAGALGGGLGTSAGQSALSSVSSAATAAGSGSTTDDAVHPLTALGLGTAARPNVELLDALNRTERLVGQINAGGWIITAVEELVKVYRELKLGGYSTHDFIRQITWRPIASIVEKFGSSDLVYDKGTGRPLGDKMIEGFHSRAFGPYTGLGLLDHKPTKEGDGTGTLRKIDEKIDPREERWLRVRTYAETLRRSRGLLG